MIKLLWAIAILGLVGQLGSVVAALWQAIRVARNTRTVPSDSVIAPPSQIRISTIH